tara:strand:- start:5354 stop:5884 length:531 start_codon:yes stop_codon:yes gene_type:complete
MNKLMKFGFAALTVVFLITSSSQTFAQSKELSNTAVKSADLSMDIKGMTCAMGCARALEVELNNLDGVETAKVNFENANATLAYNSSLTSETTIVDFVNSYRKGAFTATAKSANKCGTNCTKPCCSVAKKACSAEEKAKCASSKVACDKSAGKACCAAKKVEKSCDATCSKPCCEK